MPMGKLKLPAKRHADGCTFCREHGGNPRELWLTVSKRSYERSDHWRIVDKLGTKPTHFLQVDHDLINQHSERSFCWFELAVVPPQRNCTKFPIAHTTILHFTDNGLDDATLTTCKEWFDRQLGSTILPPVVLEHAHFFFPVKAGNDLQRLNDEARLLNDLKQTDNQFLVYNGRLRNQIGRDTAGSVEMKTWLNIEVPPVPLPEACVRGRCDV